MDSTKITDVSPTETRLTLMTGKHATWLFSIFFICSVTIAVLSFVPSNTVVATGSSSPSITYPTSSLQIRTVFNGYSSLSSFVFLSMTLSLSQSSAQLSIAGALQLMSSSHQLIETVNISESVNETNSTSLAIFSRATINFYSMVAFIDVDASDAVLLPASIVSTSQSPSISLAAIISISIMTVILAALLVFVVSKRVRPDHIDHWASIFLCGVCLLVDGPWIICQYFSLSSFSQVFDAMPQIFHGCFVIFALIFFGIRTVGLLHKVFKNYIIHGVIIAFAAITLVLQFYLTSGKPLATFPLFEKNQTVFTVLIVIYSLYHLGIMGTLAIGFVTLKVERFWSVIIIIFSFCTIELSSVAAFLVRILISKTSSGFSFAADLLYILEANLICCILVYIDTPVCYSNETGVTLLGGEDLDEEPMN